MKIYALHGFLGLPSDWDRFNVTAVAIRPAESLWEWAKAFNATIREPALLIGYSLGARLAMHALLDQPTLWRGAIFVSGNTGLKTGHEARRRQDEEWARKFMYDPWELVLGDWNRQPVFRGSRPIQRLEKDYSRSELAKLLVHFSLSSQEDLSQKLGACPVPHLFVGGALDPIYTAPTRVPNAGHRVPWDQPEPFNQILQEFYETVRSHLARDQELSRH